jgi:uncharacterized protein YaeQ
LQGRATPLTTAKETSMSGIRLAINLDLELHHTPQDRFGVTQRLFLRKALGESNQHVVMKFLSYILFYHPDLLIEASADQHFKPDLVRFDADGDPVQWIDCGQTSLKKLDKISQKNRKTYIDIVKRGESELSSYRRQALTRLALPERVRYWTFDVGFVDRLARVLTHRHMIHATVTAGYEYLYMLIDGVSYDTRIIALHDA